jgi:hypothetical protein
MRAMQDRNRAVSAVKARLSKLEASPTRLAEEIGIAENTFRDFLAGRTWPIMRTMGRIEKSIGWPPGSIEDVANGGPIPGEDAEAAPVAEVRPIADPPDPRPQAMTVIGGGGLRITIEPAEGKTLAEVVANMAVILEATSKALDELEGVDVPVEDDVDPQATGQ